MIYRCPICRRIIRSAGNNSTGQTDFLPFCSYRCRLIDLGHWLDADYKILTQLQTGASERCDDEQEDRRERDKRARGL